jgi:hypothetical protein
MDRKPGVRGDAETNLHSHSCRPGRSRAAGGACAYRARRRAPFRAGCHYGLRPHFPASLGRHRCRGGVGWRGYWWARSGPTRQSIRYCQRTARSHGGRGRGVDRRGQRRAGFGLRHGWSRHWQRGSWWRWGFGVGADRPGLRWSRSSPIPSLARLSRISMTRRTWLGPGFERPYRERPLPAVHDAHQRDSVQSC